MIASDNNMPVNLKLRHLAVFFYNIWIRILSYVLKLFLDWLVFRTILFVDLNLVMRRMLWNNSCRCGSLIWITTRWKCRPHVTNLVILKDFDRFWSVYVLIWLLVMRHVIWLGLLFSLFIFLFQRRSWWIFGFTWYSWRG